MTRRASAAQKRHWDAVAALGCIVTGGPATIHHCHGGSMKERGVHRGAGMKTSNWLVIPLAAELHTGPGGIDGFPRPSVEEWEAKHGRQADMLDEVARRLGVDVWALAASEEKPVPERSANATLLSPAELIPGTSLFPARRGTLVKVLDRQRTKSSKQLAKEKYRKANPDKVRDSWKRWYSNPKNAERAKQRAAQWKKEHLERERVKQRLYMRRKRAEAKAAKMRAQQV